MSAQHSARLRSAARALLCLLCCCMPLLAACSLVKLSDKIGQAHCSSDTDCDVLNDGKTDACEIWQCSPDTKYCVFGPLDKDHDGYYPAMCQKTASKVDCNDAKANQNPGNTETCDGIDNDCDGNIDEDALTVSHDTAVVFGNANQDGVSDLSYATDPASGTLGLGFSINRTPNNVPGIAKIANDLPSGGNALEIKLPTLLAPNPQRLVTNGVGIGALGAESFAVAFYDQNGTHRVLAGAVDITGQTATLKAPSDILIYGLHCEAGEPCAGNASGPATVTAVDQTETPSLAAQGDDVLVTYVRNLMGAQPEDCHAKSETVPGNKVLANWLQKSAQAQDGLDEISNEALLLGKSDGINAPTVLAVPPIGAKNKVFGWLVAFTDENGAIGVHRVTAAGSKLNIEASLLSLSDGNLRYSAPRLTLGPSSGELQTVGIAYQRGCGVAARVAASVFTVGFDKSGAAKLTPVTLDAAVGGGPAERHASMAYSKDADSERWAVVYRDPKGVRARVLSPAGKPVGEQPYKLIENAGTGGSMVEVLLSPGVVGGSSGSNWFGALGYVQQGGSQHAIASATLGCKK